MIFNYLENHCDYSFHPYDSLYINYHMYIFNQQISICLSSTYLDCNHDNQIWYDLWLYHHQLSNTISTSDFQYSFFYSHYSMCIGFISIPHYLTKLIFIIIVVQNGNIVYPYSKSSHSSSNILYHPIHIIFDRMIQNITLNIQYILDDGSSFNWFNYSLYWYPYCINTLNLSLSIKISHSIRFNVCRLFWIHNNLWHTTINHFQPLQIE